MRAGDRVRLVRPAKDLEAGAEGKVLGFYREVAGENIAIAFDSGAVESVPVTFLQVLPAAAREKNRDRQGRENPYRW